MSISMILGSLPFNTRGQLFFGMASTAISLQFADEPILGFVWHLKYRKPGGDWEQFFISDPTSNPDQRNAYIAAVNSMDLNMFIGYLAPNINAAIQSKFGEYIGAGVPLPPRPNPAAGLTTEANIVERLNGILVNDWQFTANSSGVPVLARK